MLIRTVRMTFRPDAVAGFLADVFAPSAPLIRAFPGCRHLALWRDLDALHVLTTYSLWDGPEALEAYRQSDLFRGTWARTKPLFAARPEARSHLEVTE